MAITHLVNRQNLCLTILATILIVGLLRPTRAGAIVAQDKSVPEAQVLGVIVNNTVVLEARAPAVVIVRGPGGCEPTEVVRKGVVLCKGDRITTQAQVMVKIAFGDPRDRNEVTIGSRDGESEITISSTSCGRVCQWFSSLRSVFINRTRRVAFINRSTVYEVVGEDDESVLLYVFEGEVEATRIEAEPLPGPSPAATRESVASAAPIPGPAPIAETSSSSTPAPLVVGRLFKVTFDAAGNPTRPVRMTDTEVCTQLRPSSDAEIALHKQPAEIAGNVAKFPNYTNNAERNDRFRTVRCNSFLNPSAESNFEELGFIYNDWGNAEKAFAFLSTAVEKWRLKITQANLRESRPRDKIRINLAIALRQLGRYEEALAELTPMITEPELLDDAYNVRGSIHYDNARRVLLTDRTEAGTTAAEKLLERAQSDYESAKHNASGPRQYTLINLAQVSKTRGDIAQLLGDLATDTTQRDTNYRKAEIRYKTAINWFWSGETSENKFARLLEARAHTALGNTYAALGKTEESVKVYALAEKKYREEISRDDTFAAAYCGLASLNLILGKPEVAENYRKCLTFNPSALVNDVEVPPLIGLRRAAAIQTLAEVGLEPEIVTDGKTVESQDPAPGDRPQPQRIKIGEKVKLSLK